MKKILVIITLATLLASCGTKNDEGKTVNNLENKPQIHTVLKPKTPEQKYGKIAVFIKEDLNSTQEEELQKILEDRKALVLKIKDDLIEAKKQGKFDEKMLEVVKLREKCASRILPYVKDDKIEEFEESCKSGNELLRKKFG